MTTKRSSRDEPVAQHGQRARQAGELVVHGDANRLEEAREVGRAAARSEHGANGADQIVARRERPVLPAADDLARETGAARLVAIVLEDLRQRGLVLVVQDCRGVPRRRLAPCAYRDECRGET